ncbi:hypothetical protein ALI144C_07070 [Actinosynnema sp. ALI-1.44]|uniref:hypothetical protein n=1 Tax=Actinosynnema sp. ALI-1.44 TaxID=1933779 RepID=UPI00097BEA41|nr:hypothetical protein [Actinosynnema sp. ALI-1.44]ONI88205.1 hypothetical protein ALI144C_07070 [Actinosynnema sp. ALI-1.44]
MSGFRVNSGYLRGYARQLEADRDHGVAQVSNYSNAHGRNFDRFSGLLEPAQWYESMLVDLWTQMLDKQRQLLTGTVDGLRQTADEYDRIDQSTASSLSAFGNLLGEAESGGAPAGGGAVAGPFTQGANVAMAPPKDENLVQGVYERIEALVGEFTDPIKQVTGYDIIAEWTPVLLGDWGALRRHADAWDQVGKAMEAIEADLNLGMGILMPEWQGGEGTGGGAPAFEQHMRDRVILSCAMYKEIANLNKEGFDFAAISYEAIITNGLWLLEYYGVRFRAVVKKVVKALREVTINPKTWYDLIDELVSIVDDYIDFVKNSIKAFEICVKQLIEMIELGIAEVKTIMTLVEWKMKGN